METASALIRSNSTIELDAETTIHVYASSVIEPGNTEYYCALRLQHLLKYLDILGVLSEYISQGIEDLAYRLLEFFLVSVPLFHNGFQIGNRLSWHF